MAFFGKVYTYSRHENFDGFLRSIGIPDDKIQLYLASKTTETLVKNGDSYTLTTTGPPGDKTITFQSGVEIEGSLSSKEDVKSTFTVDGNTITQVVRGLKGTATFKKEYNGDELVMTVTSDSWDGVAKRYYTA